jgi:hypothetical protein
MIFLAKLQTWLSQEMARNRYQRVRQDKAKMSHCARHQLILQGHMLNLCIQTCWTHYKLLSNRRIHRQVQFPWQQDSQNKPGEIFSSCEIDFLLETWTARRMDQINFILNTSGEYFLTDLWVLIINLMPPNQRVISTSYRKRKTTKVILM